MTSRQQQQQHVVTEEERRQTKAEFHLANVVRTINRQKSISAKAHTHSLDYMFGTSVAACFHDLEDGHLLHVLWVVVPKHRLVRPADKIDLGI